MPPASVWLACIPYALVVTTVLIGKHIDKLEVDKEKGIHTLPVLMGDRTSRILNAALMIFYYVAVVALVLFGDIGLWVLLVFLAVPRLISVMKTYRDPKPEEPPEDYPVWPLWYVSAAFYHNKLAGGLFVLGLILNWVVPPLVHGLGIG
jgi:1,4-dihydroxy-2-naphthoate octaprenyltransferase